MRFMTVVQLIVFFTGLYFLVKHHAIRKQVTLLMAIMTGYIFFLMYGFPPYGDLITLNPLSHHMREEIRTLINLACLLIGFACLSYQFEKSGVSKLFAAAILRRFSGRVAESLIMAMIWFLSGFIDNIAAALIGMGLMVIVHGSFSLRLVIAVTLLANAGGAYSVIGDTTTTLMWIHGISQGEIIHGFLPSFTVMVGTIFCSVWFTKNHRHLSYQDEKIEVTWWRFVMILICIGGMFLGNYLLRFPCLGIIPLIMLTLAEWKWEPIKEGVSATCFLVPLVMAAGFINLGLAIPEGFLHSKGMVVSSAWLSGVIDNIPITKLLLDAEVGHWALLAFCVGVGGSMTYFGSTTSVAIIECYHKEVQGILQQDRFKNLLVYWVTRGWYIWPVIILGILVGVMV